MAHKFSDYNQLGGFPATIEDWVHDRTGIYETISALYADGAATPMILSGSLGSFAWLVINREVVPYTAPSTLPPLSLGSAYYIVIVETKSPATFQDLSVKNAIDCTRVATLVVASSAPSGGVLLDSFVEFKKVFGDASRGAWQTFWNGTGTAFDGTVFYKKNILANTLQLRGSITVKASGISSSVGITDPRYWNIPATSPLPIDCRPAFTAPFIAHYRYHLSSISEINASDFIDQLNAEVTTGGGIMIGLRKPASPATAYTVTFNTIIPLD